MFFGSEGIFSKDFSCLTFNLIGLVFHRHLEIHYFTYLAGIRSHTLNYIAKCYDYSVRISICLVTFETVSMN